HRLAGPSWGGGTGGDRCRRQPRLGRRRRPACRDVAATEPALPVCPRLARNGSSRSPRALGALVRAARPRVVGVLERGPTIAHLRKGREGAWGRGHPDDGGPIRAQAQGRRRRGGVATFRVPGTAVPVALGEGLGSMRGRGAAPASVWPGSAAVETPRSLAGTLGCGGSFP